MRHIARRIAVTAIRCTGKTTAINPVKPMLLAQLHNARQVTLIEQFKVFAPALFGSGGIAQVVTRAIKEQPQA
ncbi:hypothetical protein D3C75_835140 [compost metagenome]